MAGLIPICVVDEVSPTVLNSLLLSDDGNERLYSFVCKSLQDNSDLRAPMMRPASAFSSPFLNMTFDNICRALQQKRETLPEDDKDDMSQEVFIIVDAQSAEDSTVWLCQAKDPAQSSGSNTADRPVKVRAEMPFVGEYGRDLQEKDITMEWLSAKAEGANGVLGTRVQAFVVKKNGEVVDQAGYEESDEESQRSWSQSSTEQGDGSWNRKLF